jgi:hypothetical protein
MTTIGKIDPHWLDACLDNTEGGPGGVRTIVGWLELAGNFEVVEIAEGSVWADGRWLTQSRIDDLCKTIDQGV